MSIGKFLAALATICFSSSVKSHKIWGPGLTPALNILPVQYFFVQLEGGDQNNATDQYEELDTGQGRVKEFRVQIDGRSKGQSQRFCQPRIEVLQRSPDFYIVRYKLYMECTDMHIRIYLNGKLLRDLKDKGTSFPDHCNCPQGNLKAWISKHQCNIRSAQMDADLGRFKNGVHFFKSLDRAEQIFNHPGSHAWCHYIVKSGDVYRKCYGEHVGFSMFWDALLSWLGRRTRLPDLQFMANLGDWPLVKQKYSGIPMFSWCGSKQTQDIILPTYELTESVLECMGRQSLDVLSAMGKNQVSWEDKDPRMFWRGRDSRRERLDLVKIASKNPDLINASITNWFFFRDEMEQYGGRTKAVSFFDFFNFKYQLNIDGTVAAYRFPYLLAGGSLVFKQESEYFEHFYSDLKPWVHYVPVKADLSDLIEKIRWAKNNDDKAKEIVNNAQKFVLENLLPEQVLCYHAQLLDRWAAILTEEPAVSLDMVQVPLEKPDTRWPACRCEQQQEQQFHEDGTDGKQEL